jgi:peptidoglycan biosynthesis protein MviN/MurJ (putative lipid II flippase)
MIYLLKFLGVMLAMAITDVCWAYYFIKVDERRAVGAGLWAVALFVCGATVTANYVNDRSLIFAAALGAFVGTWATIAYKKKRELKDKNKADGIQDLG